MIPYTLMSSAIDDKCWPDNGQSSQAALQRHCLSSGFLWV